MMSDFSSVRTWDIYGKPMTPSAPISLRFPVATANPVMHAKQARHRLCGGVLAYPWRAAHVSFYDAWKRRFSASAGQKT